MSSAWNERTVGENDSIVNALRVLRRRWPVLLGCIVLFAGLSVALQGSRDAEYEAESRVLFNGSSIADDIIGITRGGVDPERDAGTAVEIATSTAVAKLAADDVGDVEPGDLLEEVEVEAEDNANVLSILARDTDPERAAQIANAVANAYIDFSTRSDVEALEEQESSLRELLESPTLTDVARAEIQTELQDVATAKGVVGSSQRLLGEATAPSSPATMSAMRAGILGGLIGAALGLLIAFVFESLDRRITSLDEFEREYRARVLTVVPEKTFRVRVGTAHVQELEPFRILRSALDVSRVAREIQCVMVTSAMPGEGKTTVSVDLAHAIALAGRHVTVVELDLRRPTFARHFELSGRTGVTTALVGRGKISSLLQQPVPSLPYLSVLPAGPLPPNPAELLESTALDDLLEELTSGGRMVVLDTPPLVAVADSQVLLRHPGVDAGIVVARSGVTTREHVRRARAVLDGLAFEPLGVVVTGHEDVENYYGRTDYAASDPVELAAANKT